MKDNGIILIFRRIFYYDFVILENDLIVAQLLREVFFIYRLRTRRSHPKG